LAKGSHWNRRYWKFKLSGKFSHKNSRCTVQSNSL